VAAGDPHLYALRHEPQQALVAGDNGLAALRRIVSDARLCLSGWLLLEHGSAQAEAVHKLFSSAGFSDIEARLDLQGHPRCTGARLA
jgi:release factor glutamine methyltransferase